MVYGNLAIKNRTKLSCTVSIASKIVRSHQLQLCQLYQVSVKRKTCQILNDTIHPLNVCFQRLPSGSQFRVPFSEGQILVCVYMVVVVCVALVSCNYLLLVIVYNPIIVTDDQRETTPTYSA